MLAGVVLHTAKALFPMDAAGVFLPHGEGDCGIVDVPPGLFLNVKNLRLAYKAGICCLSAALGEKGAAVKDDGKAVFYALALQYCGFKFVDVAFHIVKLFGHDISPWI